jgi:hypothetical protein
MVGNRQEVEKTGPARKYFSHRTADHAKAVKTRGSRKIRKMTIRRPWLDFRYSRRHNRLRRAIEKTLASQARIGSFLTRVFEVNSNKPAMQFARSTKNERPQTIAGKRSEDMIVPEVKMTASKTNNIYGGCA